jgi:hypothetical protein
MSTEKEQPNAEQHRSGNGTGLSGGITPREIHMAKGLTTAKPEPSGRFSTAPSLATARMICSNDTASAATAASYRYESRVRELEQRFEIELQGVRDAYLQELAGLDLEGQ